MEGSLIAGRYRVDHQIGEGGVALVYRGTDQTLDRRVAIKVLRPELSDRQDVVARFRREAHAAAKLNHPNIVQIYDTGVDDGRYYIVMEYLPELNLKEIIKRYAPLPLDKVVEVGTACCDALSYAHRQGLVHRDVKPANVLFTDDGRAKLSDFGIAAAAGEAGLTDDGKVLGSAHYISPEQAQGAPAGPLSDIYSLGVTLYEAMTGRLPFGGETAADIAAQHLRETPPSPRSINEDIPPAAEFVIMKAMSRDPQRRYRSADEMKADIAKLERGMDLDQTGVLRPTPDATMQLPRSARPAARPEAPMRPVAPSAPDYEEPPQAPSRPVRMREEPENPARAALAGVGVGLLALLVIVAVVWLMRAAFYPNTAPATVDVPNVRGMTEQDARRQIEERGLLVGDITHQYDENQPTGRVIDQSPLPGGLAAVGSEVDLVVNLGKRDVSVPDVTGTRLDRARSLLEAEGLTLGRVEEFFHADEPAGIVYDQEPRPGTRVDEGTAISLSVSKGREEDAEPENGAEPDAGENGTQQPTTNTVQDTDDDDEPPPAQSDPYVSVAEDQSYLPEDPRLRRFRVTVGAKGQAPDQQIEVRWRDESGTTLTERIGPMQPGQTETVSIRAQGTVTIEVYHEGRAVFTEDRPVSESTEAPQ